MHDGGAENGPTDSLRLEGRIFQLRQGQAIELNVSQALCRVGHGAIVESVCATDGRRWIVGIHVPGCVFFLNRCAAGSQAAQALVQSTVRVVIPSGQKGANQCDTHPDQIRDWRDKRHVDSLRRGFMLARSNSVEKVAYFLSDLAERLNRPKSIDVVLSREEIGDHLGLTSETVTRTLTFLQGEGMILVDGKQITFLELDKLEMLAAQIYST